MSFFSLEFVRLIEYRVQGFAECQILLLCTRGGYFWTANEAVYTEAAHGSLTAEEKHKGGGDCKHKYCAGVTILQSKISLNVVFPFLLSINCCF
jgi:hypothetical protein